MTTVRSVFLDGGEGLADLMLDIHLANGNVILFTMASLAEDPAFQALWSSGDIYRPKPQGSVGGFVCKERSKLSASWTATRWSSAWSCPAATACCWT